VRADLFAQHAALEERHWWFQGRTAIIADLVDQLAAGRPAEIVDVGCGTGALVRRLAPHHRVIGFDPSPDAVALARQLGGPGVQVERATTIDEMRPALAHARIVLLMDVLEHLRDDFFVASELVAAMAPGAMLIVTVPADPALWSSHDIAFAHYRRYTRVRLQQLWAGLPVTTRLVSPLNRRLRPLVRMVRGLHRRRWRSPAGHSDLTLPIRPVNTLLRHIFASERIDLMQALSLGMTELPGAGVSWLTVLQREYGSCLVRTRPAGIAADQHDPDARHVAA
jgi:2-polyprenyl-3-methyl-5-hydroxy-6-metoxy-1,4-benzoquinol methylase